MNPIMPVFEPAIKRTFFNLLEEDKELFSWLLKKEVASYCYWEPSPRSAIWVSEDFWKLIGYYDLKEEEPLLLTNKTFNSKDFLTLKSTYENNTDIGFCKKGTFTLLTKSGDKILYEIISKAIRNETNELTGIVIAFLEKKENTVKAIEKWPNDSVLIEEYKAAFLGNISHELRTPLNGVKGFTDLLLKSDLTPIQNTFADTIYNSACKLEELIDDMLEYNHLMANKIKLEPTPTKLYNLCKEITEFIDNQHINENIQIHYKCEITPEYIVSADAYKLRQILLNLFSNATKFTNKGDITLTVTEVSDKPNSYTLLFSVTDSGLGIAPENLEKIKTAFDQEDPSLTRSQEGMGLGLAITDSLLKLMQSRLKIESTPGKGSSFSFEITFDKVQDTASPLENNVTNEINVLTNINSYNTSFKILIAEDNPINQFLVQTILEKIFPQAILSICDNGMEAVEAYQNNAFDIILMDIQMPVMSGYEATKEIRKLEKPGNRIPVIALTARVLEKEKKLCFECGMDEYLTKPVDYETLKKALYQHLSIKNRPTTKTERQLYNLNYLETLSEGDDQVILDSLSMFTTWVDKKLTEAYTYLKSQKLDDLKNVVHAIKPSFEMVESVEGSLLCNDIIHQAKEEEIPGLITKLQEEYHRLKEAIKNDFPNLRDYEKENFGY